VPSRELRTPETPPPRSWHSRCLSEWTGITVTRIELTVDEATRLRMLCETSLSDLRMEIAGTDNLDFREKLKEDAAFLKSLIARLTAAVLQE